MYGDEWLKQLKALEGDEEQIAKLKAKQRDEFNKRLAQMLLLKKKKEKPKTLLEIEEENVNDKEIETFCADWVKREMDEEAWRKLNEKERQRLMMEAKIAFLKLQKELYGDDWLKKLRELEGNDEALRQLRQRQREELERRLREMTKDKKPQPENIFEVENAVIEEHLEEKFCADWVKREMDEEEWRKLSEQERQKKILEAKLAFRKLQKELYGEDWIKQLKLLEGNENELRKLRERQKAELERRLKEMMNKSTTPPQTPPQNLFEVENREIGEKEEETFCADWVKLEMDEEEWRKLSEQERQKLIAETRLAERQLRRELYGEEWRKELETLRGNEAALEQLRTRQRALFAAKLKERMEAQMTGNILFKIVAKKYEITSSQPIHLRIHA